MMKNAKMNEKGKLLAIIAVFAMVFAGAAVVMSSEGVDANPAATYNEAAIDKATAVELKTGAATINDATKTYYVADGIEVTVNMTTGETPTVYVLSGKTVTFVGDSANTKAVKVVAYYVKGTGDAAQYMYLTNTDTVDTSITLTALKADDSVKITPTIGKTGADGSASSMKVSGKAISNENAALAFALGNASAVDKGAITVNGTLELRTAAATAEALTGLTWAWSMGNSVSLTTVFNETAKKTYAHEVTDASTDTLTINKVAATETVTASIKVTSDKGTTTFKLDATPLETALTVTMTKADAPTIAGGSATTVVTLEKGFATKGALAEGAVLNGVAKAVEAPATPTDFYAQIYYKHSETTADVVGPYNIVKGTVTQTANADLTKAEVPIVVGNGDKLIINENVTVKADDGPINGTVELYGALLGAGTFVPTADAGAVKNRFFIGPIAYTDFTYTADVASKVQNIASVGKAFEINQDVIEDTTVGSAVIGSAGITIPAGHSLTVNGDLGLNGHMLTVNGKLIVTGSVYSTATASSHVASETNVIIIGATGDVDIAKDMAVNTFVGLVLDTEANPVDVILRGVDGLEYSAVDYKNVATPAISGTIVANTLSNENVDPIVILNDTETIIPLPLTISSGVTLDVQGDKIVAGGLALITLEGSLVKSVGAAGTLELESLSSIVINGMISNVKIVAYEGEVSETVDMDSVTFEFTVVVTGAGTTADPFKRVFVTGLTITVMPEVVSKTVTMQHVYVEGELAATSVNDPSATAATTTPTVPDVKVTGARLHVDEDDVLVIPATSKLTFTIANNDMVFMVEGTIEMDSATGLTCKYYGGHYAIETKESGATKTTQYYEPFAEALLMIDSAKNKTVDACISKFDFNFNITDGQTLNLVTPTLNEGKIQIDSEAMIIIENGGKQTGVAFNDIQGVLVQQNGATIITPDEDAYAAKTVNEETGDVTYSGLIPAIKLSVPGSVITILNGKADGNLVIPAQRTVIVEGQVELYGDLTVEEGAIITGGDFIFVSEKATTHNLRVEGVMDADEGSITHSATSKIAATVTGVLFITSDQVISEFDSFTGAGWETATGYALSTIDEAVVGAVAAGISEDVTIFGNVVWVADIEISKVVIKFNDDKAALNFAGTVTLDDATINVDKGTFTGTVTASTTLLGSATVEFTAVKGTLKITEDDGLTLSDKLDDGIVSLESGVTIFGDLTMGDALLMVGEHATAHVHGETKITDGVFTIVGTVAADNGGRLALEGGINMVSATGTLVAQRTASAGNVDIKTLTVYGTLKEDGGVITITANAGENSGLIIGDEPSSLGAANGTVIGNITTGAGKVIMIYAGADFDEMKIDGATTYKATVFMINGVEYQYLVSSGAEDVTAELLAASDYDLPGYDGTAALKTIGGWDFGTASPKVGTPALVTATLEKSTVDVTISPIKGMSIVVDGVTYKNTTEAELKVGEHTLSFTLDPGYKIKDGSSVTMTFNGVKVTNSIIITPGMVGQDLILAASGDIVIDQEIPEQEKQDDTVIIILLAILVVMVVILAIVTILRMMRS